MSVDTATQIALLIFVLVFVGVLWRAFAHSRTQHTAWSRIPLDEESGHE